MITVRIKVILFSVLFLMWLGFVVILLRVLLARKRSAISEKKKKSHTLKSYAGWRAEKDSRQKSESIDLCAWTVRALGLNRPVAKFSYLRVLASLFFYRYVFIYLFFVFLNFSFRRNNPSTLLSLLW